ncbi:Catalase domain-containing protein [Mycena chlorophos]|uniref:Catalase domain-containing protein n=1 Tax=Mycena chlorophos TaxID=658473 RepID=A0A8H6T2A2_MYCCL|nr:Catalase domain-containing protein [Mycena chlorophos]
MRSSTFSRLYLLLSLVPFTLAGLPDYTDGAGHPVNSPYDYQRAGNSGPLLLQDFHFLDLITHFDNERIPERIVHAKGSGAHGYFEVTNDITDITMASPFSDGVGTRVPLTMRFSTVAGETGSPDTNRDPRGFAIKMRTKNGIWDWVFNNTPVFFIRDPTKFQLFIHSQKRDPATNLRSPTLQWDYWSQNQEAINQVMRLFSDRGTPASWAEMDGYSGHTYKFVTAEGKWVYVKLNVLSTAGLNNLNATEALSLAASNPDYNTQELQQRINSGNYPTWNVSVQTMTWEQSQNFTYDVNDLTKTWPTDEYPLRPIGQIVLNKNPQNWFAEIEQLAFSPAHMVPGVEPSNDPVLQARLFAYSDTARHRLGPNHLQIPINCPMYSDSGASVANFQRAAWMRVDGGAGSLDPSAPNYPSSFAAPVQFGNGRPYNLSDIADPVSGPGITLSSYKLTTKDFEQPNALYNTEFSDEERSSLVANVITALKQVTVPQVQQRSVDMFACVDPKLGNLIGTGINVTVSAQLSCGAAN